MMVFYLLYSILIILNFLNYLFVLLKNYYNLMVDSWGAFIQNYLVNNVHGETTIYNACESGALFGPDGTIWASTEGFKFNPASKVTVSKDDGTTEEITINEFDHLKDAIEKNGDTTKMKRGGVHFMGIKWVVLDGFKGEGYYTQYFKRDGGGAAVTRTDNGNYCLGTWNAQVKAVTAKGDDKKEVKQSVGFCNNAVDDLSKVLAQSGL